MTHRDEPVLGVIDSHGTTGAEANGDDFAIASLGRSVVLHRSSLQLDDRTRIFGPSRGHLFVVADGTPRVSATAIDAVMQFFLRRVPAALPPAAREDAIEELLRTSLAECRARIDLARDGAEAASITFAFVLWPRLFVVHTGNARAYLNRGGLLHRITADRPARGPRSLRPDVHRLILAVDDELVLCTEHVTRGLADGELPGVLASCETAREACDALLAASADGDAGTVVVARFREREEGDAEVPARLEPDPASEPDAEASRQVGARKRERPRYGRTDGKSAAEALG